MSGGGKGRQQSQTIKLPKEIESAAKDNLALAKTVGSLPYAPYFGPSVAAFTPAQEAAFKNADSAASAYGLSGGAAGAMPAAQTVNGMSGYSTKPFYDQAMSQVPANVLALYNSLFYPNNGSASPSAATASKGSTSATPLNFENVTRQNSLSSFK